MFWVAFLLEPVRLRLRELLPDKWEEVASQNLNVEICVHAALE